MIFSLHLGIIIVSAARWQLEAKGDIHFQPLPTSLLIHSGIIFFPHYTGLALGIIIAIAVAGIVLLLLFMAFIICICFRAPPRERENVIVRRRPRPEPVGPQPVPLPEPRNFLVMQPEPEEEEPEEVVRVIRKVRVPYRVDGPPPPGYPYGRAALAQGPIGGYGSFTPENYPGRRGAPPPPYARQVSMHDLGGGWLNLFQPVIINFIPQ